MAANTKVTTMMTKRKDTVSSPGQMDASTMVNGRMESNTAQESIPQAKGKLKKALGLKANAYNGLKAESIDNY